MKHLPTLMMAAVCALLASCASSTPQSRIEENKGKFNRLPEKHQRLVERGELARGMSEDAVYLAWGKPSRVYEGSEKGVATAKWDYAALQPVYTTSFYGGYGWGGYYGHRRGPYGGYHGGGYPYYAVAPQVDYVPYRRATVWFKSAKVDSWERTR